VLVLRRFCSILLLSCVRLCDVTLHCASATSTNQPTLVVRCHSLQLLSMQAHIDCIKAVAAAPPATPGTRTSTRWGSSSTLPMVDGLLPIGSSSWLPLLVACGVAIGDLPSCLYLLVCMLQCCVQVIAINLSICCHCVCNAHTSNHQYLCKLCWLIIEHMQSTGDLCVVMWIVMRS
jgi:hypothetical protein